MGTDLFATSQNPHTVTPPDNPITTFGSSAIYILTLEKAKQTSLAKRKNILYPVKCYGSEYADLYKYRPHWIHLHCFVLSIFIFTEPIFLPTKEWLYMPFTVFQDTFLHA